MRTQATILEYRHVTKRFGKTIAVNDVSLDIKEGEIYGLLGPNGAGKTTLIKTIVGHLRPDSGTISIAGYDVRKEFVDAIDFVGAIVEYPMHYLYMTGMQNLKLTARMYTEVDKARIEEVVDLVGLRNMIQQPVHKYSLGSRQRLALAQSILNYPQLLILDEPMNGFDPVGMRELSKLLRSLADNGTSILVTSHITNQMESMCDRIGILSHGYLIAERAMNEFRNEKSNVYDIVVAPEEAAKAVKILNQHLDEELEVWRGNPGELSVTSPKLSSAAINRMMLNNGIALQEITVRRLSLESLYTQLTGGAEIE
ncbi:MAG: ABC transporter ATP-binding protein [Firmicutes bacterium]|nr:ABC transporter ATP-binding protein [Bacillota bacterium]